MGKRKKIGLIYDYDENWIGGTYYVENLIEALNTLSNVMKPAITILSSKKTYYNSLKDKTAYPFLKFESLTFPNSLFFKIINKLATIILKRSITKKVRNIDTVFPFPYDYFSGLKDVRNKIFWIPDFQDHFIPELFKPEELFFRKSTYNEIAYNQRFVVLSSENAKTHFEKIYPNYTVRSFILPFAVSHPKYDHISIGNLLLKYNLPDSYFMSPNQFWKHKNHIVIIEAIKSLRDVYGIKIHMVFSGKTSDYRNPGYYDILLQKVSEYALGNQISFLGFINRSEQLKLMKHSKAIVQPSLFEGWSTVVEDAKAMNKMIIASGIPVHIEQLQGSNAKFFDSNNPEMLMTNFKEVNDENLDFLYNNFDYKSNIKLFGQKLNDLFDYVQ